MTLTDLTNCDQEPIHIPGHIQSHGFLVAVGNDLNIVFCSDNLTRFIPVDAGSLLGNSVNFLGRYFQGEDEDFILNLLSLSRSSGRFKPINPYRLVIDNIGFNLIISESGSMHLLEFEPRVSDLGIDLQSIIGSSLSVMLSNVKLSGILNKTAEEIKQIIGYDRVMIYKFHDDGHGEVVSEAMNSDLDPLLGLHYPASDIPKQARELYKINLTRLIADVDTVPSGLLAAVNHEPIPLDLTNSALRAVSPIHIQYLKNMGVASSFSVSILHQGELWGLVACHNYTPRFISFQQREAARLIGQVLSSALSFRQDKEEQQHGTHLKLAVESLTRNLIRYSNLEDALFSHDLTLLDAVEANGAVLMYDGQFHHTGITPDNNFLKEFAEWLDKNIEDTLFVSDNLSKEFPAALDLKDIASGVLVCRLSKELNEYMIWFRPELISTVVWAGKPDNGLLQISPRKSFESWSQQVECKSFPWKSENITSALQLKEEVTFAINRKASEIRIMNEKLKEAYDELDAFSYTISHDLKNPLTTIKAYAQLLKKNFILEPKAVRMVDFISDGADQMYKMIGAVLNYSKAGQILPKAKSLNMKQMLSNLVGQMQVGEDSIRLEIGATPDIFGDETMVRQVFSNLIGNAIKYSRDSAAPVIKVNGISSEEGITYSISDNGIGIDPGDHEIIFGLFKRADGAGHFEGSGVGLAIVKKIMERHNGRIWLESEKGKGSTFYIHFKIGTLH